MPDIADCQAAERHCGVDARIRGGAKQGQRVDVFRQVWQSAHRGMGARLLGAGRKNVAASPSRGAQRMGRSLPTRCGVTGGPVADLVGAMRL